jgi:hypothetical protein
MDIADNDTCGGFSHGPLSFGPFTTRPASANFLTIRLTAISRQLFMRNYTVIAQQEDI